MEKFLEKIERYAIYATTLLLPITFLYISPNPFVVSKIAVLIIGLSIFFIARSIRIILSGKLEFSAGNFDLAAILFLVAYAASALLRTPNKMEAILVPGTATIFVGAVLLYFAVNQLDSPGKRLVSFFLTLSGAMFSLITILSFFGAFESLSALPAFVKSRGFSPEGGYLPSLIFLSALLPIALGFAFSKLQKLKMPGMVSSLLILAGILTAAYNMLPGKQFAPRFLSYSESWNITVDSLKVSPLLGVGPGNYLTAFNRFRTLGYNAGELWAVKFATARSGALTSATEVGLLGLLASVVFLFGVYKIFSLLVKNRQLNKGASLEVFSKVSLFVLALAFVVAPSTLTLVVMLFVAMALSSKTHTFSVSLVGQKGEDSEKFSLASRLPAFIVTLPVLLLTLYVDFTAGRILVAENTFKNSVEALAKNEASNTYDTMARAVSANPRVDRYRVSFSRVNLVLANAIAAKTDITDTDRQSITTLVQQAIREAKAAVALNPFRAGNWESLGQVYRAIMPLATGADDFAIQSYRQAIALDPINPNLRIALGGLYFAKKDYENAVRVFELAVAAKPDHANARYNLAVALGEDGRLDRAIAEMTVVVSLVKPDTKDAQVAKEALANLQAKKSAQAGTGEELTPPQEAEEPVLEPPLELPEESQPPEAPLTPTPTEGAAEPTPEVSPAP